MATELETLLQEPDTYSDPEDYVDEVDDQELLGDLLAKEPTTDVYEDRCVMVFGIPVISKDRLPRLQAVLAKVFGLQKSTFNDYYPLDENDMTKGYCFIEYPSKDIAEAEKVLIDGFVLDKNHTFSAYSFNVLKNLKQPDPSWKAPQKKGFTEVEDLWYWVRDPKCVDQFAIEVQAQKEGFLSLAVYTAHNGDVRVVDNGVRKDWSENIFKWSPYGTYLTTIHKQGVCLWGGNKFTRIQKFSHEAVSFIEYSPKESYLVTYSHDDRRDSDNANSLKIFDVFTGECKKTFSPSSQGPGGVHSWPFFKWSHDEKYFAFCRPKGNNIFIYDTETFSLNSNKPIELDGLVTFEWNPSKNMFAYYCEERPTANAPAEIGIVDFPSREKIRAQRIFSVSAANLFWQKAGNYLAAHTERYNSVRKTKEGGTKLTGVASHLEIFDFSDKLVAVQTIQLTEPFISFGWEPKGDRFCVLQGTANKSTPLVYRIEKDKPVPQCISKLESDIQLNTVSWSPQGGWLVVYANGSSSGHIVFIDTNGTEATKTRGTEHGAINYAAWDPTGRFFATACVGNARYEPSYRIHTFQGRELYRKSIDLLLRFRWRPRPPVQLSEQKQREIKKNLKQTSLRFEEEDRREQQKLSKELLEERHKITEYFYELRSKHAQRYEEEKDIRIKLRNGYDSDKTASDTIEEQVTVVVNTEKTEIKDEDDD